MRIVAGITLQYESFGCRSGHQALFDNVSLPPHAPASSWLITNYKTCGHGSAPSPPAPAPPAPGDAAGPAIAGLIIGEPEHDFSRDRSHYYYNNNVWSLYGMQRLGDFLTMKDPTGGDIGKNSTLGEALLKDVVQYKIAMARSIATCTVDLPSSPGNDDDVALSRSFLPVFAALNQTPPDNMHDGAGPSYANFRFYSEPLLTGGAILPTAVQQFWLQLHNERGGRLGGASRFEDHLDDMPTAGWGFGALSNNRTDDFLALL